MKLNVLIVEDDLNLKPIWEFTLKRISREAEIRWTVSVEEAKKILLLNEKNKNINVIISDIFLAGSETGVDFLCSPEVIHSKAKTFLISSTNPEVVEKHYKDILPTTLFLSKPFDLKKSIAVIRRALFLSKEVAS